MAQFALKDVLPNPFRHLDRYPINKEKVASLCESIKTTGFWDNIVAREKDGKAEIAYGHHRLEALRAEFPPTHKITLITRNLSNDDMLKIMARENMEEWGTSAEIEQETIRATVEAYAKGEITLPEVPRSQRRAGLVRCAPTFTPWDGNDEHLRGSGGAPSFYNSATLANYLGWKKPSGVPQDKVVNALNALQLIEDQVLPEATFKGLTTKQAEAVVQETRRAKNRETEDSPQRRKEIAGKIGNAIASKVRSGAGYETAPDIAHKVEKAHSPEAPPDIQDFAMSLSYDIEKILSPKDPRVEKLKELLRFKKHLGDKRSRVKRVLDSLADRVTKLADKFE